MTDRFQQQSQHEPAEQDANDSSGYEYDAGSQRPISRGSKHSVDSNGSSFTGGYNQSHHSNQQQQQGQYGSQLDDDDDDMW
jgi:hypothetical protein